MNPVGAKITLVICSSILASAAKGQVAGNSFHRLDYQPLFGKGARAPPPNRPETRERRKSSLQFPAISTIEFT